LISREIDFVKASPTQNMTVLVRTEHPQEEYPDIARRVMSYEHVHAEQVGFVRKPESLDADAGLHMAGGEFCGNACMALAALNAFEADLETGDSLDAVLETSGTADVVRCRVVKRRQDFGCRLAMPPPTAVEDGAFADGIGAGSTFVRYGSALFVVIETGPLDRTTMDEAQTLARRLGETRDVSVVGVMLYNADANRLAPLVHVPSVDSMVWEKGCGSGTASLGAYLAWKNKASVATNVLQPGGSMRVTVTYGRGGPTGIEVEGSVRIVAEGRAFL
jgi:histidine racemase